MSVKKQKTTIILTVQKKITEFLGQDKTFKENLRNYIGSADFNQKQNDNKQKTIDISDVLIQCKPYKGLTYRGTRLYKKDNCQAYSMYTDDFEKSQQTVMEFLRKIEDGYLKEELLKSFTSDIGVASFFALFNKNANHNAYCAQFNFVIRNHINKTGVDVYEDYYDSNLNVNNIFPYRNVQEQEILYPSCSEFKIIGIHIEMLKSYEVALPPLVMVGQSFDRDLYKFDCPCLVIDVIQTK